MYIFELWPVKLLKRRNHLQLPILLQASKSIVCSQGMITRIWKKGLYIEIMHHDTNNSLICSMGGMAQVIVGQPIGKYKWFDPLGKDKSSKVSLT